MADVFDRIFGQPRVRDFLRASVKSDRITHAYLFTGPAGSNKTQSAYALASALLCASGGCGTCEVCEKVANRKHPDVRYYAPEGAGGYRLDLDAAAVESGVLPRLGLVALGPAMPQTVKVEGVYKHSLYRGFGIFLR